LLIFDILVAYNYIKWHKKGNKRGYMGITTNNFDENKISLDIHNSLGCHVRVSFDAEPSEDSSKLNRIAKKVRGVYEIFILPNETIKGLKLKLPPGKALRIETLPIEAERIYFDATGITCNELIKVDSSRHLSIRLKEWILDSSISDSVHAVVEILK
jgi:hypothetical protein